MDNKIIGSIAQITTQNVRPQFNATLASGVFTVTCTGIVQFPDYALSGVVHNIDLTGKSYTFNDDTHASSHLTNLGFGITETQDWDQDMPFFIYLVNEDNTADNVGMCITRKPNMAMTPSANSIHDKDAAAANDKQYSIFGAWPDDAGKTEKPCILIGVIYMHWSTTTDDWTIEALNTSGGACVQLSIDYAFARTYTMPDMQNGANVIANNYLKCTNTPPVWQTPGNTDYKYKIDRDGWVDIFYDTTDSGNCTNGSDAESIQLSIPYNVKKTEMYADNVPIIGMGSGHVNGNPSGNADEVIFMLAGSSEDLHFMGSDLTGIQSNDFSNTGDDVSVTARYKAFEPL